MTQREITIQGIKSFIDNNLILNYPNVQFHPGYLRGVIDDSYVREGFFSVIKNKEVFFQIDLTVRKRLQFYIL